MATPQFLTGLHGLLNEKLDGIAEEPVFAPKLQAGDGSRPELLHHRFRRLLRPCHELLDALGRQGGGSTSTR